MDFNLNQWGNNTEEQQEIEAPPSAKLGLHSHTNSPASSALPLFVPQHHYSLSSQNSTALSATKFPRMGSYFNLSQWQELELQTLIFRHMLAGAAVPHELLHLVKKSLITDPPPSHYLCNPLHQYYPQYQSPLVQSGYWGRSAMDPEPGRCRRTDGKKWRCSRDVVAGQKYCERHVHRGRNRSRKHVEVPTSAAHATFFDNSGGEALKTINSTTREMSAGGGGTLRFSLSGPSSPSVDLLQLNRRPMDSMIETKCPFEASNDGQSGDRTLRRFFDDWPRSVQETNDATSLSISMPGNSSSSDFSLKLGTGNGDERRAQAASSERERPQLNWGMAWDTNTATPLGGPLAEALRSSSASNSSPTSVLHRLTRSSISEITY